jgi:NAD(P)H-nitrite reductase large subunit
VLKTYDILILGNSAAGLSAATKIRQYDNEKSVCIVDREEYPAYSRVMTPYFSGHKIPKEGLFIVNNDFYKNKSIDTVFGKTVVEIIPDKKEVKLDNGDSLYYDKLLIGLGAEATEISVKSSKSSVLRHMSHAEYLHDAFKSAKSVTGIGAGLVTLPVLSHLKEDVEKNLIIGSGRIFSRVVNEEAALLIEEELFKKGVKIYKRDDIKDYKDNGKLELTLKSGKEIVTDVLVVGKGVTPNTDIAKSAGIEVNDGIVINDRCQTSVEDIYAAGDVAEGKDFITGEMLIQGNWMTAVEQGEIAAKNMLGIDVEYEGSIKNNITEIFGIDVAVVGYYYDDAPFTETYYNKFTGIYRKVFMNENKQVIGATLLRETNASGLFYEMIKTKEKFPKDFFIAGNNSYAGKMKRLM